MRIIIIGDGKVGSALMHQLTKEGHELTIIDNRSTVLKDANNRHDVMIIKGNGADLNVLNEANAADSDLVIAATSADEVNILCCLVAKKLGCKHTIARVRNPEYSSQLEFIKDELGLSMSVNPEQAAAIEINRIVAYPNALKIDSFVRGKVELVEIKIGSDSPLINLPLSKLHSTFKVKVLICAIKRGEEIIIPKGDVILQENDKITITGSLPNITTFIKRLGIISKKIRSVMIVGGGKITYYLAKSLCEAGIDVKIIEKNPQRCLTLCDYLPKALIIEGDGTDRDLLLEEGITNTDAFIALTDMDEENIIISMYASYSNVKKVITKVNRITYPEILEKAGIDTIISPKYITASQIVRFVRAMANAQKSTIEALYRIIDNRVEALEFRVDASSKNLHIPLKDIKFKENLLLGAIFRKREVILPSGLDTIEVGDHLIVVTTIEGLTDINDIFA